MNRDYPCPNGCEDGTWTVIGTEPVRLPGPNREDPEVQAIDPDGEHAPDCRLTEDQRESLERKYERDAWEGRP
jgi:hypothetical protein